MKLAFCLFKYFEFGGQQRDAMKLARACVARGHEVTFYVCKWEGEQPDDMTVTLLPNQRWFNHSKVAQFAKDLKKQLKQDKPDRVIAFQKLPSADVYYAADICLAKKINNRAFWHRYSPRIQTYLAFEKAIFEHSKTKILALTEQQKQDYQTYYHTPDENFTLLPPDINPEFFNAYDKQAQYEDVLGELGLSKPARLLLFVGSGFKTKGLDRAIRALAALKKPNTYLMVIGKDNPAPFLKLAKQLQIQDQVKFLGGRKDTVRFYRAADLLIHPAYFENTGLVLLEALATGLPVMTTETTGYAHYVADADAGQVIANPFSQTALNTALMRGLNSDRLLQTWSDNATTYAASFKSTGMVDVALGSLLE